MRIPDSFSRQVGSMVNYLKNLNGPLSLSKENLDRKEITGYERFFKPQYGQLPLVPEWEIESRADPLDRPPLIAGLSRSTSQMADNLPQTFMLTWFGFF